MYKQNIFNDIINKKIPADIVYQDKLITAFRDAFPKAPVHIIIVPNISIATINDVLEEHEKILGHIFTISSKIAKKEGINKTGYRLIMNCNKHGGQEIYHIHMHLIGGKQLGPII